jgi:peptidoglycan/LPS O-acetylase OafA/YrhL
VVSILLFLLGLVVSLVMAHALHTFVERPAMQFSARFKKRDKSANPLQ